MASITRLIYAALIKVKCLFIRYLFKIKISQINPSIYNCYYYFQLTSHFEKISGKLHYKLKITKYICTILWKYKYCITSLACFLNSSTKQINTASYSFVFMQQIYWKIGHLIVNWVATALSLGPASSFCILLPVSIFCSCQRCLFAKRLFKGNKIAIVEQASNFTSVYFVAVNRFGNSYPVTFVICTSWNSF